MSHDPDYYGSYLIKDDDGYRFIHDDFYPQKIEDARAQELIKLGIPVKVK